MDKHKFEYNENGIAVSDFRVEKNFKEIVDYLNQYPDGLSVWIFSTENIFSRIRLGIIEKEINWENVVFVFENSEYSLNKYGQIENWPENFLNLSFSMAEKILLGMFDVE